MVVVPVLSLWRWTCMDTELLLKSSVSSGKRKVSWFTHKPADTAPAAAVAAAAAGELLQPLEADGEQGRAAAAPNTPQLLQPVVGKQGFPCQPSWGGQSVSRVQNMLPSVP